MTDQYGWISGIVHKIKTEITVMIVSFRNLQ